MAVSHVGGLAWGCRRPGGAGEQSWRSCLRSVRMPLIPLVRRRRCPSHQRLTRRLPAPEHGHRAGAGNSMSSRRRGLRALTIAVVVALVYGWLAWWRPVAPASGPVPLALHDGWIGSTPHAEGFDEVALQRSTRVLLDGPYNVHAVLIERHGRLVSESYRSGRDRSVYGGLSVRRSFDATSLHDVRSIGKSVSSLLYGISLAEGTVPDRAKLLSGVFPQLRGTAASNARRVHISDLLDMDSGLAWTEGEPGENDELKLFWKRDLPNYVFDRPLVARPGTRFNYNGGGTALLAQVIEAGVGESLDRYAAERLFAPLGIRNWEWMRDMHGRPMAFNGLRLRPRDLLKIGRLVLQHGQWDGNQIVPAAWIDDVWGPGLATGVADFHYHGQWWQGTVNWQGRRLAWHAAFGNGGQRLFVIPDLDIAIVTTAGAYDELPTAIAVNRLVQEVATAAR